MPGDEVDPLRVDVGAPGRGVRDSMDLRQLPSGGGDRRPDLAPADIELAAAAVAVRERLRLPDAQQLADVAVEVLVPTVVLAAWRGVEAREERVEFVELRSERGRMTRSRSSARRRPYRRPGIVDLAVAGHRAQVKARARAGPPGEPR